MFRTMLTAVVVLGIASVASAGFLATDPAAMLSGTQAFASGDMIANVDYAVYAPGSFGDILTPDPSGGADYVYAFQVFPSGAKPVTVLTVGLIEPVAAGNATQAALYGTTGGMAATSWAIMSSSAIGVFFTPELQAPLYSQTMLFTSPFAPTFAPASVGDGGQTDQQILPTPLVPEPAGLALGVLAIGALLRRPR